MIDSPSMFARQPRQPLVRSHFRAPSRLDMIPRVVLAAAGFLAAVSGAEARADVNALRCGTPAPSDGFMTRVQAHLS